MEQTNKKLYRSYDNRIILGVCGGLAEYFGLDPIIFRVLFVLLALVHGLGIIAYAILAIVLVNNPEQKLKVIAPAQPQVMDLGDEIKQKVETIAAEIKPLEKKRGSGRLLGLLILIGGCLLLADVLFPGLVRDLNWQLVWAMLAVVLGLYFLSRKN